MPFQMLIRYGWNSLLSPGRRKVWKLGGIKSSPLVKIVLTDLSKTGVGRCPLAPLGSYGPVPLHPTSQISILTSSFFSLKDFYHEKTVNSNLENQNRPRSWAQTKLLRLRFATSDRLLFGSALLWVVPLHYCWIDVTKLYQVEKQENEYFR